jgi:polar amino acid transport system substrate-binding protein
LGGASAPPAHAQDVNPIADARREPVVPNFWDPKARATRPPPGAVGAIRFVTTDDFPPFNFLDASGRLTGFNVDLARAVCDKLSVPCTIQARPWSDLVDSVAEGRADAEIGGIAITPLTRQRLGFSDVYLRIPARFAARRDTTDLEVSAAGLRNRTVAVVANSAQEAYLRNFFPNSRISTFPSVEEAEAALKKGSVELYFGDALQLSFWLASEAAGDCCAFAGGPYLESKFFGLGLAIGVGAQATDLRHAINTALETVYSSGTYAELYLRYFPEGFF